ncbi:23S rRNA (pseudouridine(1915)-N(3))-methyltransferase RlmH [Aliarcobacter thereius]|uniref:Ribosomal RNA large subunit methyltransferase H n=1 Tax=Aliarcobacter thereius TaxID=544718 RepID=A0A5R9GW76_9BACT|nr:23S rRNA (pseudouridine(1915)-N(3))-methyltransferase RlmH [Aliarcobacter thereius]TLS70850.1 23S rRNA (pseudouridine(1915)-N(3))-methyltransferase RlmH [Aliarcobacter thereius]TLT05884.1 23S rRNA (pseudouridine(1915)-N(3))-methyltransferase RlmH [Aliarcobacter thereius]
MKINIYIIAKKSNDTYDKLINDFIKMSSKFANISIHYLINNEISKAQNINEVEAQKVYTKVYTPYLKGFNIALDVLGKKVDTFAFSKFLEDKNEVNFFIGGAYGFQREFLQACDEVISLSNLTFAHKIATLVLGEQIFRSLSILNNHPYHK